MHSLLFVFVVLFIEVMLRLLFFYHVNLKFGGGQGCVSIIDVNG